jgi:hypothetical protein
VSTFPFSGLFIWAYLQYKVNSHIQHINTMGIKIVSFYHTMHMCVH